MRRGGAEVKQVGALPVLAWFLALGVLVLEGLPAGEPGIFFYGQAVPSTPVWDGVLCTGAEYFRMAAPVQSVAAGAAWLDVDLASPPMNGAGGTGALDAGSTWRFQYWYRDSQGPTGSNLSDALDVTFTQ